MKCKFSWVCLRSVTLHCYTGSTGATARHILAAYEGKNFLRKLSECRMGRIIRPSVSHHWKSPRKAKFPFTWKVVEQRIQPHYSQMPFHPEIVTFLSRSRAGERKAKHSLSTSLKKKQTWPEYPFIHINVIENILKTLSGIYICLPFLPSEATIATQNFHNPQYLIHLLPFSGCCIQWWHQCFMSNVDVIQASS